MSELEIKREYTTLIKWKISNFSTIASRDDPNKELRSSAFNLDSSDIKCSLSFNPTNCCDGGNKSSSSLFFHIGDFGKHSTIQAYISVWVENQLGDKTAEQPGVEHLFDKSNSSGWGYSNFVHHDEIYAPKNHFVKNDIVILCCQIVRGNASTKLITELHRKLWNSYSEGLVGECTLRVSGKEFKVSKTLLTAHSDVFKSMLLSGMKETKTGVIEIDDFDVQTVEAFVEYLHFDSVQNLGDIALKLFYFADKYDVYGLKSQCEERLIKSLDGNNFRDFLILAFMHESERLKSDVLEYISQSQDGIFTSMMVSEEWIQWTVQNEKLASYIVTAVFEKLGIKH